MVKTAVLAIPQQGVVLMAALLVMVMLILMGISSVRLAIHGERAARGLRDRDVALQAAEGALADGERELAGGGADPARAALLAAGGGYAEGCGDGVAAPDLGLCAADDSSAPAWRQVDIADDGAASRSVPFGHYTGAEMETGEGHLPFRKPRYVIEQLPAPSGTAAGAAHVYRVTAIGFGARDSTEVVLQSTWRPASGPGAAGGGSGSGSGGAGPGPGGGGVAAAGTRTAWREVANYRELRRAAKP
jgi:type IV pilus assembly protein PilX